MAHPPKRPGTFDGRTPQSSCGTKDTAARKPHPLQGWLATACLSWSAVPDRGLIYSNRRDITDLKQAQERLDTLRHQLSDASRQTTMGAMTASIAHEINQPLAAIMTNASAGSRWLTRANPNLAEAQAAFDQIEKGCHRMNEVIASVRAMFGTGSGEPSVVDLRQLIDEVLALARANWQL